MAMALKREFELASLRVGLRSDAGGISVRCVLERGIGGDIVRVAEPWTVSPEAFGLPERLGRRGTPRSFHVAPMVADAVAQLMSSIQTPDNVLWLHLDRPFGYLGLVPWETLSERIARPVLRLPDVLAPPPRATPTLDVALCASSPVAKNQFEVVEAIANFAADVAAGMQRPVRIQVFAGLEDFHRLKTTVERPPAHNVEIILHDPAGARAYEIPERDPDLQDQAATVSNPWLLWIRDALQGRSLDVVHFIGHGFVAQDRGALALAESPVRNEDRRSARFVGYGELSTFLTQVGAWAIAFTTPVENQADAGVRLLADQFGLRRPGAVLHHSAALDPYWSALSQAYAFLYSAQPSIPPAHPAVAIYCQPSRVARPGQITLESTVGTSDAASPLDQVFQRDHVPAWLAASQRYFELCEFQSKAAEPMQERRLAGPRAAWQDSESVRSTIDELQGIVARFAGTDGEKL